LNGRSKRSRSIGQVRGAAPITRTTAGQRVLRRSERWVGVSPWGTLARMPTEGASSTPASETSEGEDRAHVRILGVMVSLVVLALWIGPIRSSLWLDEFGTWWVVKDGLRDAVDRAYGFQGQSPLYYLIVWAVRTMGGNSEIVLRLPSLAATAGSCVLLYRLVRHLVGQEAARMSVLVFAATGVVAFEASEARPYAVATFALIAATYALVRWLDGSTWRQGIAYVGLAVLVVWVHYMFALALVSHAAYAVTRVRRGQTRVALVHLGAAAGLIAAGVVPLALQIASLWDRRGSLSVVYEAGIPTMLLVLIPAVVSGGLLLGVILARTQGKVTLSVQESRPSSLILLASWLLIPTIALFAISDLTSITLLSPRYFASVTPAGAALAGWAIASIEPAAARLTVAALLAILSLLAYGGYLKNGEDWRDAAAFERAHANADTIVLLHPGLIESAQLDWFEDPERLSYLTSVVSYYPMIGRVSLMPHSLDDPGAHEYLEGLVTSDLADVDRFLFITRYADLPYKDWLDGRLGPEGFTSRVLDRSGVIFVVEFTRSG
jgi:mannosyltransferase